jgi:hypothetical protein
MDSKIKEEIDEHKALTEAIKRECPYCHTGRIESMGYRDSTNKVRRFRCKNPVCGKSHSRDAVTGVLISEIEKLPVSEPPLKNQRADKHLNVTQGTLDRVRSSKTHDRETDDDIINRFLDRWYGKI